MGSFKLSFALICLLALSIFHSTHAQNSQQDYLNAHNTARSQVGVGNVVWNATVAIYAQNYANQRKVDCSLVQSGGPYGENLATGSATLTGTAAVNLWVAEKQYYTYSTNTCASGHVCEHYTQVVWSNSGQIGCARVQCNNGLWFVICNYHTPGNVPGQSPY
ncbi:pathogenesis-related protein 1B [Artemisia annua]|uniref:Pathogenesis-related protein 1B n=1 Tax=Artemisia annua TaxID=35608 RepID=A0A2U1M7R6_ARTAN|nr:pathogenesis-related protein 1B [Artemisia annua]